MDKPEEYVNIRATISFRCKDLLKMSRVGLSYDGTSNLPGVRLYLDSPYVDLILNNSEELELVEKYLCNRLKVVDLNLERIRRNKKK